jgi:predicted PurR-regulated permease PerM
LILFIGITVIQQTLGNFIEPNLMGMTLNLSPLVVVMSLILWGMLWGVVGMFLCVPITVIAVIIMANFESTRWVSILLSKAGQLRI